jgi:hypothetical protein
MSLQSYCTIPLIGIIQSKRLEFPVIYNGYKHSLSIDHTLNHRSMSGQRDVLGTRSWVDAPRVQIVSPDGDNHTWLMACTYKWNCVYGLHSGDIKL